MDILDRVQLGKKPGVVKDPRTFKLKAFLPDTLPEPPEQSYVGKGEEVRMYANDRIGDCTVVAHAHRVDVQERSSRQTEIQISDRDVIEVYSAVTGYDPVTGANDNGAYMLDILNYMRTSGLGREKDGTPHTIGAFASIQLGPSSRHLWKVASWLFGGIYIGAWLPLSAARQMDEGKRWDIGDPDDSETEPGSWGGHCMSVVGYSSGSVVVATWGQRQRVTWDWLDAYVDEAYAIISEDFLNKSGKNRQGFDVDKLKAALESL